MRCLNKLEGIERALWNGFNGKEAMFLELIVKALRAFLYR